MSEPIDTTALRVWGQAFPPVLALCDEVDRLRAGHEPVWRHRFCPPGEKEQFCARDGMDWPCPTIEAP